MAKLNAYERRIVKWLRARADYLERVGSSFDHYDAGCLFREAAAIESGEHHTLHLDDQP